MRVELTARQKRFCVYYATDPECVGNATEAYMRVYGLPPESRRVASANASRLLTKANISTYANTLVERFLENINADREMAFVIAQRTDLRAKVAAYAALMKVRGRTGPPSSKEFTFRWEN